MRRFALLICVPFVAFAQFKARTIIPGGNAPGPALPNTFMCLGDSIMAGACNASSPCTRVQAGIPGSITKQFAVSGYTAQQIRDQYFANYATACNSEECGTILVEGGVNSLKASDAITGVVEQETVDKMLEIVDAAREDGRRVVWIGVLPYGTCDPSVCPTLVDPGVRATTYNALMMAACAARASPLLKCIDPYDTFESPSTANALNADYACSDNIHLQDTAGKTGPQVYTGLILAALGY